MQRTKRNTPDMTNIIEPNVEGWRNIDLQHFEASIDEQSLELPKTKDAVSPTQFEPTELDLDTPIN
jgi:hypothetical protein